MGSVIEGFVLLSGDTWCHSHVRCQILYAHEWLAVHDYVLPILKWRADGGWKYVKPITHVPPFSIFMDKLLFHCIIWQFEEETRHVVVFLGAWEMTLISLRKRQILTSHFSVATVLFWLKWHWLLKILSAVAHPVSWFCFFQNVFPTLISGRTEHSTVHNFTTDKP